MQLHPAESKRIVGAGAADPRYTRLIETLYKTKIPETTASAAHFFELTLGEETVDGKLGYFVRETQCRWDPAAQYTVRVQYTLSPRGGFTTIEEAQERYKHQRQTRAQHGYVHCYAPNYEAVIRRRRYVKIEITEESDARGKVSTEAKGERPTANS
jgi:hypothetical protein